MIQIPLGVIGGFLGAGKTTLLNHLLATAQRRNGVLVNDFGAIALTNGCVCCSMGDDLGAGLGAGLDRLARREPSPDHVIVEASGVSDPWRIAQLALIETRFTLQPLVVLVDAAAFLGQLADRWTGDTVARQLGFAELVVITLWPTSNPSATPSARCGPRRGSWRPCRAGSTPVSSISSPLPAPPGAEPFHRRRPRAWLRHPRLAAGWLAGPCAPAGRARWRPGLRSDRHPRDARRCRHRRPVGRHGARDRRNSLMDRSFLFLFFKKGELFFFEKEPKKLSSIVDRAPASLPWTGGGTAGMKPMLRHK